ncbi:MAG TPA: lasso peptide biosynthesis B2 protein [Polyangiaceae bacterium]
MSSVSARALVRLHVLHGVARLALRVMSPARAQRAVGLAARFATPFASEEDARVGTRALGSSGTCLTRALAVAALLPGSEVAIGVDPRRAAKLHAHAWVELNGRPLDDNQASEAGGVERMGSLGGRERPERASP